MKKLFLLAIALAFASGVMAQNVVTLYLDSASNGTTQYGPGNSGMAIFDDGGSSNEYSPGHDYTLTIHSNCDTVDSTGMKKMAITFYVFDVGCKDTFYIYDGPTTSSPLLLKRNNCYCTDSAEVLYISAANTTGELTFRLRSSIRDTSEHYAGIQLSLNCMFPCEYITSTIDSVFDRTDLETGEVVGHGQLKWVPSLIDTVFYNRYDTIGPVTVSDTTWGIDSTTNDSIIVSIYQHDTIYYDTIQTDSIISIDTLGMVWAALLCEGQGAIFHGHGNYTHNTGFYFPEDSNVMFYWTLGSDNYNDYGATEVVYNGFQSADCYTVGLKLVDENGCPSRIDAAIQVRVSPNPIKTIFDLSSICSNDSLMVNVGYDGDNGTLTLKKIKFAKIVTKVNEVRTFIPDGPYCATPCYQAPVDFTGEFPSSKKVTSPDEICSVCINYEHTYFGDYRIAIFCPIYDKNTSPTLTEAEMKPATVCGIPLASASTTAGRATRTIHLSLATLPTFLLATNLVTGTSQRQVLMAITRKMLPSTFPSWQATITNKPIPIPPRTITASVCTATTKKRPTTTLPQATLANLSDALWQVFGMQRYATSGVVITAGFSTGRSTSAARPAATTATIRSASTP